MSKYDAQLGEARKLAANSQKILIALPNQVDVDVLAAGLSLHLSLQQAGKEVTIATSGAILVSHSNLFGVGEVQNKFLQVGGGNLTLLLTGVVAPNGTVPSLEKLIWEANGADLKLVFEVVPGHRFEPKSIVPQYSGGSSELIFVIGAMSLSDLGPIYADNQGSLVNSRIINIDNKQANTQFGSINLVDPASPSVSEMMYQVITGLALALSPDIASNILSGVYTATNNLQSNNVNADTFTVVAEALRAGGKNPVPSQPAQPMIVPSVPSPQEAQRFDLNQVFNLSGQQLPGLPPVQPEVFTVPEVVQSSPEEKPTGEGIVSEGEIVSPEPDWLTPKIFKGGSVG